jgi:Na+(H+)/acetate symporter ActP
MEVSLSYFVVTSPFNSLLHYKFFIMIYSLWGGFKETIPIRLILYIIYISPIVSPSQTPSHHRQTNCKRFFSSVSYKYMKQMTQTLYAHMNKRKKKYMKPINYILSP